MADIPLLLRGDKPTDSTDNVGSQDYSKTPAAVVAGAGYDDDMIKEIRAAARANVPWLRPDTSKPTPPLGPEYGKAMVERVKVRMKELKDNGKLNADGTYWY